MALTTLSSLDPAQLHQALVRLRVPRTLVGLITQILIQTGVLLEETLSLIRALRLRYSQSGIRVLWLLACGIPSMWLPRVLNRAERTAVAMVWRGFDGRLSLTELDPLGALDWFVVLAATGWLLVSLLLFHWGVP
jgi:energy-coupling factor transporter transmembrane protein EcfT